MKFVLILLFAIGSVSLSLGQHSPDNDPSYSINNYKHPHKAAYAKKNSKQQGVSLTMAPVISSENYKQPYNKQYISKATIQTGNVKDRSRKSSKHPNGL